MRVTCVARHGAGLVPSDFGEGRLNRRRRLRGTAQRFPAVRSEGPYRAQRSYMLTPARG